MSSSGAFPTRRELRLQREADERAAASASSEPTPEPAAAPEIVVVVEEIPAVPVAPEAVVVETLAEPEELAPRSARRALVARPTRPSRWARAPRPPRAPRTPRIRSAAELAKRRSLRQRITGTATMVLVGGIFASLTLPAYAFPTNGGRAAVVEDTATQNLAVGKASVSPAIVRDGYGATSATDLRALYLNAARQKNMQAYLHTTARAMGDDYPWYDQLTNYEGGGLSPLRYYYRECVDFVAWRLNRDAGYTSAPFKWDWSTLTPGNGNASGWKSAWLAHGWVTSNQPVPGAVAWFPQNHVAYVNSVLTDGSVLLEEYNYDTDHLYGQRIVPASSVALYLYPPPK